METGFATATSIESHQREHVLQDHKFGELRLAYALLEGVFCTLDQSEALQGIMYSQLF